jgi:hypothetical protein
MRSWRRADFRTANWYSPVSYVQAISKPLQFQFNYANYGLQDEGRDWLIKEYVAPGQAEQLILQVAAAEESRRQI